METVGWWQLHPAGPHSPEDTSALSFYGLTEIMCVIDARARATAAAKTMNPDEGIRGNRIVFNPLNEGEWIRGIWQICIPKFSTLGLTSRETELIRLPSDVVVFVT
jgi:hypothetical protein